MRSGWDLNSDLRDVGQVWHQCSTEAPFSKKRSKYIYNHIHKTSALFMASKSNFSAGVEIVMAQLTTKVMFHELLQLYMILTYHSFLHQIHFQLVNSKIE